MATMAKAAHDMAATAARKSAAKVKEIAADLETRALIAEGRRSVRTKTATVKKVSKKALKTGLVTGAMAAAAVVVHEVRKRRAR